MRSVGDVRLLTPQSKCSSLSSKLNRILQVQFPSQVAVWTIQISCLVELPCGPHCCVDRLNCQRFPPIRPISNFFMGPSRPKLGADPVGKEL